MSNLKVYKEIKSVLKGNVMFSHEVQKELATRYKLYSESTVTRRMREMPEVKSHPPVNRKVSAAWTYSI